MAQEAREEIEIGAASGFVPRDFVCSFCLVLGDGCLQEQMLLAARRVADVISDDLYIVPRSQTCRWHHRRL